MALESILPGYSTTLVHQKVHCQKLLMCTSLQLYYVHVHLRLVKLLTTRKPNMTQTQNLFYSTYLDELQKTLETCCCKTQVTKLLIIPHTLAMLTLPYINYTHLYEYIHESQVSTKHEIKSLHVLSFYTWLVTCT